MNVYKHPFDSLFDGPEQDHEDPLIFVNQFDAIPGSDLLEVAQLLGDNIISIQNFKPSRQNISMGNEVGVRLLVAEQPVAWIPKLLAPINVIMYPFAQTSEELKNEFLMMNVVNYSHGTTINPLHISLLDGRLPFKRMVRTQP